MRKHKCVRCHHTSNSGVWTTITIPENKFGELIKCQICLPCRFKICDFIHGEKRICTSKPTEDVKKHTKQKANTQKSVRNADYQ